MLEGSSMLPVNMAVTIFVLRGVYSSKYGELKAGDIIDVDDWVAEKYVSRKYAEKIRNECNKRIYGKKR